jgi:DNA-binding protein HU-beta
MALYKMTQAQMIEELAAKTGHSKADVKRTLEALDDIVLDNLKNCIRTEVAGVTIEPRYRAPRVGRNPQTGEAVKIKEGVKVAARIGAKVKGAAPSVKKLASAVS